MRCAGSAFEQAECVVAECTYLCLSWSLRNDHQKSCICAALQTSFGLSRLVQLGYSSEVPIREKVPDLSQDRYYHGGYAVDYELLAIYQEDEAGWGSRRSKTLSRDPQAGFDAEKAGCAQVSAANGVILCTVIESTELD